MDGKVAFQTPQVINITTSVQDELLSRILSAGDVEQCLQAALDNGINPYSASTMQMQAMMRLRRGKHQEAEQWIAKSLNMRKDHLNTKIAADCAFLQCQFEKAEKIYREAMALKPDSPEIIHDLAVSIVSQGKVEESLVWFRKACTLSNNRPDFMHHLAIMQVLGGHDEQGWDMMQHRLHYGGVVGAFPSPEKYWHGEDITGKTIVIRTEQGWGDGIMFSGYFDELIEKCKKVYLYVQRPFLEFFRAYYPDIISWPNDAPPPLDFDYHVAIMCLPRLMPNGYRQPKKYPHKGKGTGFCWFGSPTHKADHLRTVPPAKFEVVHKALGENLKCLGYGRFDDKPDFVDYFIDDCKDWYDTSRRILELERIITVDTAIAHLGGFMGVETWLLLPYVPDFRWGMQGETTKWYESVRIFRQPKLMDWDSVFEAVCKELRQAPQAA